MRRSDPILDALREKVLAANCALVAHRLVTLTWGNVSGIDRERGLVAIKPSGVAYEELTANEIVVVDLDGTVVFGNGRPSTDTPTHVTLYRSFPKIGAVVHTHSTWATAWAQAGRPIPLLGTTHADLSPHPIPVTRELNEQEVAGDYEAATGEVIAEAIAAHGPHEMPCVLVAGHGPFCWAGSPAAAVQTAVTLEEVAHIAWLTVALAPGGVLLSDVVRRKHYARKHGPHAYYGQPAGERT